MRRVLIALRNLFVIFISLLLLCRSAAEPGDRIDLLRAHTRMIEFDYVQWTLDALFLKNMQESVNVPHYLSSDEQRSLVLEYIDVVRFINQTNAEINQIYANPDIGNPVQATARQREQLRILRDIENSLKPIAESILQQQISSIIAEMGLSVGGQPVPPVMYHVTDLPNALIISPRKVIRQDADISLLPELTTDKIVALEQKVEAEQDVSALVVPVGGVGIYPTMVMSSTNLPWLLETVAHEWIHNYLTLRPLGMQYMTSVELRTMNETTANIAGKEIGEAALERFYPELVPPKPPEELSEPLPQSEAEELPEAENPNIFNFNREMNLTRVTVDTLLAEGRIEEAEAYMEERRHFLWNYGYRIRRLNQAYFAFYGAYADAPGGGAAGEDPVGPAVQRLREQSSSLAAFLRRIAWISSFEGLLEAIEEAY